MPSYPIAVLPAGTASDYPDFSCRWRSASDAKKIVQVASAPVSEWVETLPKVLDSLDKLTTLSKKDKKELQQARDLLGSGQVDDTGVAGAPVHRAALRPDLGVTRGKDGQAAESRQALADGGQRQQAGGGADTPQEPTPR